RVNLDPDLLAVTAERIKLRLLQALDLPDRWQGRVYIDLHPAASAQIPAWLTSLYQPRGWQYHLDLADQMDPQTTARALVQVLLLEIANRHAGGQSAELPPWLLEGLTLHLLRSAQTDLVLRPRTDFVFRRIRPDSLAEARDWLHTHAALTFTELSLPTQTQLTGDGWTTYQASAQLFVTDLLRTPGGRARLAAMLDDLPHHLNWQTAFLLAFAPQFQSLLDVEKWWAIRLADFTGRDSALAWPADKSLHKLDDILGLPVLIRYGTNQTPITTNLPLQTVIGQWDFAHQRNLLIAKANLLQALRPNLPAILVPLVDDYHSVLATYLEKSQQPDAFAAGGFLPSIRPQILRREIIGQLDALDARRTAAGRNLTVSTHPPARVNPGPPKELGQFP
ncbi:MAG: hypothetical protein KGS61_19085, partial [Verrucomicrobia bacterium]|nr:hypothetical protein [Verrucomicrobiota bacterium]